MIRVALVGAGEWATRAHLPALRSFQSVEVVACVEATEARARRAAAAEGIRLSYGSIERLLASSDRPDLIAIVCPDDAHAPAASAALEHRIPVFCEKPLANDAGTARALAIRARRTGVLATVGYSFRFSPALQALRADLDTGVLGEPWLIEISEHNPQFHPRVGRTLNWKGDPMHARAGALFEYGSHAVDLARWLGGEIVAVSTNFATIQSDALLDDIATLQLRFASGAIGTITASWVLSGGFPGIHVRLHGSELLGEATLDQRFPGGEAYRRIGSDGNAHEELALDRLTDTFSAYARRHYGALFAALRGGREGDLPTFEDGASAQAVLEAAVAATERWTCVEESEL